MVNDDKTVSVKPVKLGPVQGEVTSIESGVAPGAMVVVDGADKLREGAKVELITPRGAQRAGRRQRRERGDGKGAAPRQERRLSRATPARGPNAALEQR